MACQQIHKIAVDLVIFNKKGEILLGKRLSTAGKNTWAFPGGRLKVGETFHEAAKREIKEELGSRVKIKVTNQVLAVRENNIPPNFIPHITIILKGLYEGGEIIVAEPNLCEQWQWFNLEEIPKNMFSAEDLIVQNIIKDKVGLVTDW